MQCSVVCSVQFFHMGNYCKQYSQGIAVFEVSNTQVDSKLLTDYLLGLAFLYIQGTFHEYFIYTECYTFKYNDHLESGQFDMFTFYVV